MSADMISRFDTVLPTFPDRNSVSAVTEVTYRPMYSPLFQAWFDFAYTRVPTGHTWANVGPCVFLDVITTLFEPLVMLPKNVPVKIVSFQRYIPYVPDAIPDGMCEQVIVVLTIEVTIPKEQVFEVAEGVAVELLL